jgi:hypothetical protein
MDETRGFEGFAPLLHMSNYGTSRLETCSTVDGGARVGGSRR